ncbi:MAG TPA: hypothetical protein VFB38_06605 [Chthonomonadaceae bacterium]|nr:hypothetical protein [Chthonomonadaceae bacterium]
MAKKSWIVLAICVALAGFLVMAYFVSQPGPETLTQTQTVQMLDEMKAAVARKDVNTIMAHIAPTGEAHIAGVNPDQLRLMLIRGFRSTGKLRAEYSNVAFHPHGDEATVEFDLVVYQQTADMLAEAYPKSHVTLQLRRVEVPRLWGLFQGHEWRIVGADTDGPNLSNFGEY